MWGFLSIINYFLLEVEIVVYLFDKLKVYYLCKRNLFILVLAVVAKTKISGLELAQ
jgi:hypothetical protein